MTVQDIINRIRNIGIDYDEKWALPKHFIPALVDVERQVLNTILDLGLSSYPLPRDANEELDVSIYAESYALPATFWRPRRLMLSVSAAGSRPHPVQLVTAEHGSAVPFIQPSAYIEGGALYPVDGVSAGGDASDRIFGWQNADTVDVLWVPAPTTNKSAGSDLDVPDDAVRYLTALMARWAAQRGRSSDLTNELVAHDMETSQQELVRTVHNYAAAGYRGA